MATVDADDRTDLAPRVPASLRAPVEAPAAVGLDPAAAGRLRDRINADVEAGSYDGAIVLLARGGRIGLLEAIGSSDLERGRAARVDDVFLLMSMTKAMTAVATLQLVDRGLLGLDTRVAEVIPEFGAKGKQRITVFHLLTHTAGVWSAFSPAPGLAPGDMGNLEAMVRAVSAAPLQHLPGERVTYSPWAGYAVLGELVRRLAAGAPSYAQVMTDRLFAPLGMEDTSIGLAPDAPRRVPVVLREVTEGVAERAGLESLNRVLDERAERPSGGAFSTALDVFRFAEMLRNGGRSETATIVSPALTRYALRNHTGARPNTFWDYAKEMRGIGEYPANLGLGVYVRGEGHHLSPLGQTASPGAFGAIGGGSTGFVVDPAWDLTFVFLSAGFLEGLNHFARMQRLADMAIACATV